MTEASGAGEALRREIAGLCWFYRGGELDGDETNWFGPNPRAVEEMLRAVGFSRVERVFAGPAFGERLLVAANRALRGRGPFLRLLRHGRVVYHAYR